MKNLKTKLFLILTILSSNAFSITVTGTLEDAVCAEIDPFAIGDACILFTTDYKTGKKMGLVYSDYDWAFEFVGMDDSESDMVGDEFISQNCEKIYSKNQISALKDYDSRYFYLSCETSGFSWK